MSTDENLLFGVLALQADFIDAACFVEACAAWAARKDEALADLLVRRGWLTAHDRAELDRLLQRKLHKHQGDARASLAEATSDQVRHSLAGVADPDVQRSLAGLPGPSSSEMATTAHEPQGRGRYTLARLHAQGGIGQVWLARDEQIGREVALKELRPERKDHTAARARFLEEARVTGQLEHPGIVPVYELAHGAGDSAFYTMRLVRGRTLGEAIKDYHHKRQQKQAVRLELRALLSALVAACNAVAYAHSRGVIHRDLKPSNVVLGDYGEVIVLDWGLAKVIGQKEEAASLLPVSVEAGERDETVQGQVLGTPGYMAPEQAEGRLDLLGPATDVYGLGAILYQILTGAPPFDGGETPTLLQRVVREQPQRPCLRVPATSRALEAVCLKALAKKPADRYVSASELAREVERWLADEPVTAWREPLRLRMGRWVRRHQALVTGLAAGLLVFVLLGGAAGAWWAGERQRQREAVVSALERVEALTRQGKLQEARGILEQAESRVSGFGSPDLRQPLLAARAALDKAQADVDLVERLEAIRKGRVTLARVEAVRKGRSKVVKVDVDRTRTDLAYARAFAQAGLGKEGDDVQQVARQVNASGVRAALLAALDAWAVDAPPDRRAWVLAVARAADPDPVRDRLRDPALWADKQALARAVAAVDGSELHPPLAAALGLSLEDRDEGEKLLRQAQKARPSDFWLTLGLSRVLATRGKFQEAETYCIAAIALRPDVSPPLFVYGWILIEQGRAAEAEMAYRKAVVLAPGLALAHACLGVTLIGQGKYKEAENALNRAIEIEPDLALAHFNLGVALLEQEKYAEAEAACRKAIGLDPTAAAAHCCLGLSLAGQGKHEAAVQAYRDATRIAPKEAVPFACLGAALVEQEKFPEAEEAYRKATVLAPREAYNHAGLAAALVGQGKYRQAEKPCRDALEIDHDLALAHACLGVSLLGQGKYEEAEAACRRAIKIEPTNPAPYEGLGAALEQQGKWAEAGAAYQKAIDAGDHSEEIADKPAWMRQLAAMHPKLPAYLCGKLQPADNDDRLALATLCRFEWLYAAAARYYEGVFEAEAELSGAPEASDLRFEAACSAALAAAGRGGGARTLDDKGRARLRGLALRWLKIDVALWDELLRTGKAADVSRVRVEVQQLQTSDDLAGVRGEKALQALPEGERKAWAEFWSEVEALRKKSSAK